MIPRTEYIEKLKSWKDEDVIKVVTGISGCRKSTLVNQFIQWLKSNGVDDSQIIMINLEDVAFSFKDYIELHNYIISKLDLSKKNYVFLDEIQNIKDFQKAVDSLYIKNNIDVYITGSNAYLLSGSLATLLSGRYIEIKMLPLSFKEFVSSFDSNNYYELFLNYMKFGGLPGCVNLLKSNPNGIDIYGCNIFYCGL